ncbi:hypothetical protein [Corynebacterium dentalis]|uniref:hypothetical protein n=1 Tax=Corynebacterium dentalis TaxID=2014528 RepID=UPI0028A14627|nr:hypothetical protein [Corynebacterium dentalis]
MAANDLGNGIPSRAAGHGLVVGSGDEVGHCPQTVSLPVGPHAADSQEAPEMRGDLVAVRCPETAPGHSCANDFPGSLGTAVYPAGGTAGDWTQDPAVQRDTGALVPHGQAGKLSTGGPSVSADEL